MPSSMTDDSTFIVSRGDDRIQFVYHSDRDMWTVGNAVMNSLCAMYTLTSLLEDGYTYRGSA